ncbi:uncharacterized protein STEHIDRAFT_108677 [Stereum hirsutum FP-91666 SS1]|uniref:uncharacterized protein n=1 Tax=Stereum hirsutum (strain FP-91666) TaxID=721885 RepID=UPI0004410562|nr:uncharacterized protein STEHIDRAFT_108677 [Stereum hirsutum FP-91666 SS1]EIM90091.1 hypothetical protein STEHIDRAFT_108677 [Stereum hirsutum FP-91666 SS1]
MDVKQLKLSSPNGKFVTPSTQQLRSLVLDYLCHSCYTGTARAFAQDSTVRHLDADGDEMVARREDERDSTGVTEEDLKQVEIRREIQTSILSGSVDTARSLLQKHFPDVLSPPPLWSNAPIKPRSSPDTIQSILPFSVDPMQLDLNLRILAFLETSRTIPLEYPPRHPSQPSTDITMDDASSPSRPSTPATSNIREPLHNADSDEHLSQLFQLARELYECAENLNDPADRVSYQKELSVITSVMAYKDPEHSHLAKYYTQARREQVAEQINSAILHKNGGSPISSLELYVRYTTTMLNTLNDLHVKVPSTSSLPSGLRLARHHSGISSVAPTAKVAGVDKDVSEVYSP